MRWEGPPKIERQALQVRPKDSEMSGANATGSALKSEGGEISGDWPFIIMGAAVGMILITLSIIGQRGVLGL